MKLSERRRPEPHSPKSTMRLAKVKHVMIFSIVLVGLTGCAGLISAMLDGESVVVTSALALATVFASGVLAGIARIADLLEDIRDT